MTDSEHGSRSQGEFDLIKRYFLGLDRPASEQPMHGSEKLGDHVKDVATSRSFNGIESAKRTEGIKSFQATADGFGSVALGNGDDAALLKLQPHESLCVSIDSMVAGVHFPEGSAANLIAYRSVAAATSDLAAMGARPIGCLLALTIPSVERAWLAAFRKGLEQAIQAFNIPLVGGDTTCGPLTVTVQVLGAVEEGEALRRDGAKEGDALCVSGTLGDAAAGLAILNDQLEASAADSGFLVDRFWKPRPALALARQLRGAATAAIDISDGLLADAGHIASASALGLRIESARLPMSQALGRSVTKGQAISWALSGGEDFELCFSLPSQLALPEGCTRIGTFLPGSGVECDFEVDQRGFQHF